MDNGTIPLSALQPGQEAIIVSLAGCAGYSGRLAALGFTPGATVKVMRNGGHGPILVSLLDTQIALGRGQAFGISVRLSTEQKPAPPLASAHRR